MRTTGVHSLDFDLNGGIRSGIVEISGAEASGKSTLALSIMREASLCGERVGIVCASGYPDPNYLSRAGPADAIVVSPHSGESSLESSYQLLRANVKVVVIDSVTSIYPSMSLIKDISREDYSARLRMLYHALTNLRKLAYKKRSVVVCVNEVRSRMFSRGVKSSSDSSFEDLSDLRIRLKRTSYSTEYGKLDRVNVGYKILKSLLSKPGKSGAFVMWPDVGIDRSYELLSELIKRETIKRSGAYFVTPLGGLGPGYSTAAAQVSDRYDDFVNLL